MAIDRLGPIDPISKLNKTNKAERANKAQKSDSINVSDEARFKAEFYKAAETVKMTSDVRADKIAEVKQKLEDPNYIDDKVLDTLADRLLNILE